MIYTRIPPTGDFDLKEWASTMSSILSSDWSVYGISQEQSVQLAGLVSDYITQLTKAKTPTTRGPVATFQKESSKEALLEYTRGLAKMIGGNPAVSVEDRLRLGLHIPKPRTRQEKPGNQPDMDVLVIKPTSVRFRAHNGDVLVRRLPPQCKGMTVWTYVGDVPPVDFLQWQCQGPYTRPTATIDFGATIAPGSRVWIAACWYNSHGQGPMSTPLEVRLSGVTLAQQSQQEGDGSFMHAA